MTNPIKKAIEALEACAAVPWMPQSQRKTAYAAADALRELEKQEPVKYLLDGQRFKLSFQEVECNDCGTVVSALRCVPLDQYTKELQGRWVALVPAGNDQHLKYTSPAPSVPEGFVLVPKEPTPEILSAMIKGYDAYRPDHSTREQMSYRAMLAAASAATGEPK